MGIRFTRGTWGIETVDPKTGQVRGTPFTRVLGFNALRIAYEAAREHALARSSSITTTCPGKRAAKRIVPASCDCSSGSGRATFRWMRSASRAISETTAISTRSSAQEWRAFVDEARLDGISPAHHGARHQRWGFAGERGARDAQAAAVARDYLDLMLSYRGLDQVLCWGLVDKYSWLQNFSSARRQNSTASQSSRDELASRKPLWQAIAAAFACGAAPIGETTQQIPVLRLAPPGGRSLVSAANRGTGNIKIRHKQRRTANSDAGLPAVSFIGQ